MKKFILVSLAIFAAIFIVITLTKNKADTGETKQVDSAYTALEKEKVIKFWEQYRKATDFRMQEQWEQAAAFYQQALALNDQHEDALYYLGNSYLELSRYKEAEECWQKLAKVNPRNSRAYLQLGTLYLSSEAFFDLDKAEKACEESLKINKEETGPLLLLGEVHLIRGQLEDAAGNFEKVTASNFKSAEAYFLNGYIAWKKGVMTKARDQFSEAVKYSKPADNGPSKVVGEGDTKHGKGFGSVTSKSVFRNFFAALPGVQATQLDQTFGKTYNSLDAFLTTLRKRVH